jgi:hypothetical protein
VKANSPKGIRIAIFEFKKGNSNFEMGIEKVIFVD